MTEWIFSIFGIAGGVKSPFSSFLFEHFVQSVQCEQSEQYEQSVQSEQYEQSVQREQFEQSEQSEQREQFEQSVQPVQREQYQQYQQYQQSEHFEQSVQPVQPVQREQFEQSEQSEQYEQSVQCEQSVQREQREQFEQRVQLTQFLHSTRLSRAFCAASSVPKYSTLLLLPLSSVSHVVIAISPPHPLQPLGRFHRRSRPGTVSKLHRARTREPRPRLSRRLPTRLA